MWVCKTTTVTKVGQCSGRPEHRRGGLGVWGVGAGEGEVDGWRVNVQVSGCVWMWTESLRYISLHQLLDAIGSHWARSPLGHCVSWYNLNCTAQQQPTWHHVKWKLMKKKKDQMVEKAHGAWESNKGFSSSSFSELIRRTNSPSVRTEINHGGKKQINWRLSVINHSLLLLQDLW